MLRNSADTLEEVPALLVPGCCFLGKDGWGWVGLGQLGWGFITLGGWF